MIYCFGDFMKYSRVHGPDIEFCDHVVDLSIELF